MYEHRRLCRYEGYEVHSDVKYPKGIHARTPRQRRGNTQKEYMHVLQIKSQRSGFYLEEEQR